MKRNRLEKTIQWLGTTPSLIIHTLFFAGLYGLRLFGFSILEITLFLNTFVSLEAIYLELSLLRTSHTNMRKIDGVAEDIEEISDELDDN